LNFDLRMKQFQYYDYSTIDMLEAFSTILDFLLNIGTSSKNLESAKYFLVRYHYKSHPRPVTIFFFSLILSGRRDQGKIFKA